MSKSITNSNPEAQRFILDWHAIDFNVDLRGMANPASRVMMVLTGLPVKVYLAIDNISVAAAPNVVTVPSTRITVQPGTTGSFNTTPGTSNALGLPVAVAPGFTVDNPNAGTVALDPATGTFLFTPNPGFSGAVTVTYQSCDNQSPATCSDNGVIVFDVPPPANVVTVPSTHIQVLPGTTGSFDTKPGTSNTLNLPVAVDPGYTVDKPDAGVVAMDPATGIFSFTPNPGFTGAVTVTYQSCDNQQPPICSVPGTIVFEVPSNVVTVPSTTVTVQPGTTGTFNTTPGTGNSLNLPVKVDPGFTVDDPSAGSVTLDPATGTFSFTPNPGFTGSVTVTYKSCDNLQPATCSSNGTITFQVPGAATASPTPVPVGGPAGVLGMGMLVLWAMRRQAKRHGAKAGDCTNRH